jgi:hydrogenase maturation protein HypF
VGFRPFICRLASKHGLLGEVENRTDGVHVTVQGDIKTIDSFSNDILQFAPPASHIKSIEINPAQFPGFDSFRITGSKSIDNYITEISPDIAVCKECLGDMESDPHRIDYPFTNCTNCGPRFSIIRELPYDRPNTTMNSFRMCDNCRSEYSNILDRRFHAQPVACNSCGPVYSFKYPGKNLTNIEEIITEVSSRIASGKTVAVKGTGGYFLMCDALDNDAVMKLRRAKHRDAKPFAVMFRDPTSVRKYCFLNKEEEEEIISWKRPVLILEQKEILSPAVSNGLNTTGAILPYMPFHYLLFKRLKTEAVVFTSGNISDDPIIIDDAVAERELSQVTDSLLSYNRLIENRTDDSVLRIIDHRPSIIRRSRGYVPRPVELKSDVEGILALGAEQKNSFCIGKGRQAVMSQYIGDLKNDATFDFYREAIGKFTRLFRFKPDHIACDLHPDYMSTQYAEMLGKELNIPLTRVQHHHAHIASCMAEHGIDQKVIGVSLDGTGFGNDGNIWGGEFLITDLSGFSRYAHFDYVPLPGGDKAIAEPWRMAFSYLFRYFGGNFDFRSIKSFGSISDREMMIVKEMIQKKINCPLSSGAGRLFDAVSALLGLCTTETFDSEAPMRLESAVDCKTKEFYPFSSQADLEFAETFAAILEDLPKKSIPHIATKFHNTVGQAILEICRRIREETELDKVVLSGGVFQNKYLLERSLQLLSENRFRVYTNHLVPTNDGGISLGQMIIASKTVR